MHGFVIGNGESRKNLDLNLLKGNGPIYGCNALYRDFSPDVLFSRDTPMLQEIKENYIGNVAEYEKPIMRYNGVEVKIPHNLVLAGSVALWCMCTEYARSNMGSIFLIGFDPYPSDGGKNNIYKNTTNYGSSAEPAAPRIKQCIDDINYIIKEYGSVFRFIAIGNINYSNIFNCESISIELFLKERLYKYI